MQDLIEQVVIYTRGMWRYRWVALILAWVTILAGWVYIAKMPDTYEASARVYVDTDSILRPLLRGLTVQTNVVQRLQLMTRTLFSRPNLEKVARMTDMDINAKTPEDMEALIDNYSNNIKLTSERRETNLYTISFQHRDPQTAKRIVQAVLTIFVESSLGEARKDTDTAQKFLDQQIEEYEARLIEAENRLTEFKRSNLGVLPGQGGDYFGRLQNAQSELKQARLRLQESEQIRTELEAQLEDIEASEDEYFSLISTPVTSALDGRIHTLQSMLDELLLRYTEQHPDVAELRNTIAILEKQREEELAALAAEAPGSRSAANPMYQQTKVGLGQANANVAAAKVRVQEYENRVADLNKLVDILPQVETELKRLNRDYAVNKKNYDELLNRRETVKMSEEAEQTGDNVKFRVIDPPRVPLTPSGPNRPLFSSLALLAAIGLGMVTTFLLSQINPAIYNRKTLQQISGLPVFATISRVWTPAQLMRKRLQNGAFALGCVLMLFAYGAVLTLLGSGVGDSGSIFKMVLESV